jgi:hypothetical protein
MRKPGVNVCVKLVVPLCVGAALLFAVPEIRAENPQQSKVYCKPAGGDIYCIPVEYFSLPPIDPSGFAIRISYPAMTPAIAPPSTFITVQDAETYRLTDDVIALRRVQNPISGASSYGLRQAPSHLKPGNMDLFYEPKTVPYGRQPAVINCGIEDPTLPLPRHIMCTHNFVNGSTAITITYRKQNLAHWATIKADVLTFIRSFKH